jgi:putative ABC transport system permease protein
MAAHGWTVGADIDLTVETGRRLSGTLVAMLPDGGAPAELLLRRAVVRQADPSALTDVVYLATPGQSGALPGDLAARVTDSVGHAAAADAAEDRLVWQFTLILVLMAVGFTILAVANTQAMATMGRRNDLAVLRRSGATPRQVLGMMATETLLVVAIGVILGTLVAAPALLAVRAGLQDQVGVPVPLAVNWPTLGVVLACCLLLGTVSSVLPARSALRRAGRAARAAAN